MENGRDPNALEMISRCAMEMAALTGRAYFEAMVSNLSQLINADVVLAGEFSDDGFHARTVAIVNDGEIADDFEFSLAESPFAHLLGGSMCIFPSEIQVLFPEDYLLADLSLDAFAGLPLFKDGKIIGCLVALYRQPIEDSVFADHALHFFASRVAAELERKQSFDRLKEYESFLFGIVDLIEDVLFVADLQGRIKLVSNSAVNLFGWLPREMAGESFADYLTDDTRQLGIQEFEKHITSVLPRLCIKLKIKDKSGTIHPIVWSALTTRINNETSSCVGIIRKITNAL